MEFDYFNDAMNIYLDYILRQFKKNPKYKPHPLIRAISNAIEGIEKAKEGENIIGISNEGTKDSIYEPYMVVIQKKKNVIEIKKITNLQVNKQIPVDVMITIFRLQIQLDKIDGETVTSQEAVDALNSVIPGDKFYALGNKWREARDKFLRLLKEGKIHLPPNAHIIEEIKKINSNTPWENYSNRLRALIGPCFFDDSKKSGEIVVTTPKSVKIEKYKVFSAAIEFLLGKTSGYFKH